MDVLLLPAHFIHIGFHQKAGKKRRHPLLVSDRVTSSQHEHHSQQSFQDEYRAFLKEYQVEFDERYVWD